jgi:hypothetical protein
MTYQPSRTPVHEVAPATDADFARLQQEALTSLLTTRPTAAKTVGESKPKAKKVKEKTARNAADKPDGDVPSPQDDAPPKPWEMSPEQLRAHLTAALWPEAESAHQWVPQKPMTLDQYLEGGA